MLSCGYPAGLALRNIAVGQGMKGGEVPIIDKQDLTKSAGAAPGLETCVLVGVEQGSQSLHIEEVTVAPNARIPRRIHPHTPTVSLGVTSAVASSCGHDSGQIEQRVAQ